MNFPEVLAIIFCGRDPDYMDFDPLAAFLGLILTFLIVYYSIKQSKKRTLLHSINEPNNFETDILGQPKSSMPDRSNFKTITGTIRWRNMLLFLLLLLGIVLINNNKPRYKAVDVNVSSGRSIIEKPDLK